ncbi:hypothetical protein MKZ21_30770 [Paenibacillus sp. FSL P2-0536]|uniref:hypothetical protein n=1 Tax=Paenibacillus sp. FSL P2-0536 TaxID=2921629 RepID=UPI0030F85D79
MRNKIKVLIDLEDIAPECDNWLVDTVALQNCIQDRLEVTGVTVHDIDLEVYE